MYFKKILLKNFRNFEEIAVDLNNKNIFFGLNDVGKTNFLYALRFVFDKDIRKNNLVDTDFFQKRTDRPIEIIVTIDIGDLADEDSQKLRAKIKGNISSGDTEIHIRLFAEYNPNEMVAIPELSWGSDLSNLGEMKIRGSYYDIDYVFNTVYIDAYVDMNTLFRKNANQLINSQSDSDKQILSEIDDDISNLNQKIGSLSGVKAFETQITPKYKSFRDEDIEISVQSEIAIKGLYSNIVPYIKNRTDNELYPTSGEGRKKLIVYSIFDLISSNEKNTNKINLFLVEEPENHLHRSMQLAISRALFGSNMYKYLFVTTHSPNILSEMDGVNLIRVFNDNRLNASSCFYEVPLEYKTKKNMLNRTLSEAIFAHKVLLVEGPSEFVLFTKVLSEIHPDYELDGVFILPVNGIAFEIYRNLLTQLGIKTLIKTDNDLRKSSTSGKFFPLGFSRVNKYVSSSTLPTDIIDAQSCGDIDAKRDLYDRNQPQLDLMRKNDSVYLSRCGLEEDLDEVLHDEMCMYLPNSKGNPIEYLQSAKNYHMVELTTSLTKDDCQRIFNSYNFACLMEVMA